MKKREFDYKFCNHAETFGQPLINFLAARLFNGPAIEKVKTRYLEMIGNFEVDEKDRQYQVHTAYNKYQDLLIPIEQINDSSLVGAKNIGIDLPVWFNYNSGQKVMIIAMEPKRNDDASVSGFASLSTPFALASLQVINHMPSFSLVYNFIKYLIQSKHSVYVTDIGKIYSLKDGKKQTGDASLNNTVFEFELKTFDPHTIICFGKEVLPLVTSMVYRSLKKQTQPIYFPRPASRVKRNYIELFNSIEVVRI